MKNYPLSLFKGYADTCPVETTLAEVVNLIRNRADIADHTRKFRYYSSQQQQAAARREKASCPCFAVSVRFAGGKQKANISSWTGLCLADFDHLPADSMARSLALLRADPHTLLAYTTISGEGIRVISAYTRGTRCDIRTENRLHAHAFRQMNAYYAALIGLNYDEQCKNATRLSGLAHDPDAYFNPDATPFLVEEEEKEGQAIKRPAATRRLQRVVKAAQARLEQEGLAYTEHRHNEYIMRMGYLLNAYGVEQADATRWALQQFAGYDGDVAGIMRSCYQHIDEHGTLQLASRRNTGEREPALATVAEIEAFLTSQASFRKNTVTGKCEIATGGTDQFEDLTDRHVNTLWSNMCKEVKAVKMQDLRAVLESEFVQLYNPFAHYFESLPPWDGVTDYIDQLASRVHVKSDQEQFALFFKKWLVAMTASLLNKEVVNHEILVLIGRQGIYKTTWLNNLLPPRLRRYFYLKSNSRNITKDDLLTLSEFAMVCLEELDEMEGKELNQLKALTTMRNISERAAYAHYKEVRAHIASFCGTGNNKHFLTDLSGNRRWLPFEVESIDSPYDFPPDYDGIYAQSYALVQEGYPYWLSHEETEQLNKHNRQFETPCLEQELILTHYRRPLPGEESLFVTNAQILACINAGIRQKLSPVKIGIVMHREGFEPLRAGGKRGYRVVELSGEEIRRNQRATARYV